MSPTEYQYGDLARPSVEIRLLRITGSELHLETHLIEEAPPYIALSYTWAPADEAIITRPPTKLRLAIGDSYLEVFEKLHRFLAELRSRYPDPQSPIRLWADAICINQANVDEVSRQVSIMDKIYSQASEVLVWLGPDGRKEMGLVEQLLGKTVAMSGIIEALAAQQGISYRDIIRRNIPELLDTVGLPPLGDNQWLILLAVYQRNWFRRLWVIQEAALARQLTLWCGRAILSWDTIEHCAVLLNCGLGQLILTARMSLRGSMVLYHWQYALCISDIRGWSITSKPPLSLGRGHQLLSGCRDYTPAFVYTLLGHFSSYSASDPRDKVFGTIGLLRNLSLGSGAFDDADYSLDVSQVYTNAAKKIISDTSWLGLLSFVRNPELCIKLQLPSWVPGFTTTKLDAYTLGHLDFNATGRFRWLPENLRQPSQLSFAGSRLRLPGHRIATVMLTSESLMSFFKSESNLEAGTRIALQVQNDGNYPANGEPMIDAVCKTMVVGTDSARSTSDTMAAFAAFWLNRHISVLKGQSAGWLPIESILKTIPDMEALAQLDPTGSFPGHRAVITGMAEV